MIVVRVGELPVPRLMSRGATPAAGSSAPDFTLPSRQGRPLPERLSRQVGRSRFYPKDQTQGCSREAQGLNFKRLADTNHTVIDSCGSLTNLGLLKFAARHTFLTDPDGKIGRVYTSVDPMKLRRSSGGIGCATKGRRETVADTLKGASRQPVSYSKKMT